MPVILAPDEVTLYAPSARGDAHGWALPGNRVAWHGAGSLQEQPGASSSTAADRGGHGPADPAAAALANLYLPQEAEPVEGMTARVRGRVWALSSVRFVSDPTGNHLDCWVASAAPMPGGDG